MADVNTTYECYAQVAFAYIASLADKTYEVASEDLRRGESLYASVVAAERERNLREVEARRAEFERGYLRPTLNACATVLVDIEAEKAARPAIGKPLSRRARRRNRGRITAARVALSRVYHEPVTWAWPAPGKE